MASLAGTIAGGPGGPAWRNLARDYFPLTARRPFLASQNKPPTSVLRCAAAASGAPGPAAGQSSCHRGRLAARDSTEIATMATIGTFTEKDGRLTGKIQTLCISTSLAFVPNENKSNPDAPTFRVFAGRTECGAACEKTSSAGRTDYSVRLDDLTFTAPMFASLIAQDEGSYALIWARLQQRRD
jgi:uncharacterized protein (DUF736 family)